MKKLIPFFATMIFLFGRIGGERILRFKKVRKMLPERRRKKLQRLFANHGAKIVFAGRFAAMLRAPLFITAGLSGVRPRTFLTYNGLAALISVPLIIAVGIYFGESFSLLKVWVLSLKHGATYITIGAVVGVVGYIVIKRWINKRIALRLARLEQMENLATATDQETNSRPGR